MLDAYKITPAEFHEITALSNREPLHQRRLDINLGRLAYLLAQNPDAEFDEFILDYDKAAEAIEGEEQAEVEMNRQMAKLSGIFKAVENGK